MTANATVGVICHLHDPTLEEVAELARAAEDAGAAWLGVPDAFWWRDTWLLTSAALDATSRLGVGPMVTNPFLRHPFHTLAAIATLQGEFGARVRVGLGAGGSEVSGSAATSRTGAPRRIEELVALLRGVAAGAPLDATTGRTLEVPLAATTVTIAGRGDGVLRAAGRVGDEALLWAVPASDLDRSAGLVAAGVASRPAELAPLRLVWAPLVVHADADRERARVIAAYGLLNAASSVLASWDVDDELTARVRAALVGGGAQAAAHLVPEHVLDDVADPDRDPAHHAATARRLGASAMSVPAHAIDDVGDRVAWASEVLRLAAG